MDAAPSGQGVVAVDAHEQQDGEFGSVLAAQGLEAVHGGADAACAEFVVEQLELGIRLQEQTQEVEAVFGAGWSAGFTGILRAGHEGDAAARLAGVQL